MSADNTIILLELKDQYRVKAIQAADNLYSSWIMPETQSGKLLSIRLFEYFSDATIFTNKDSAISYSFKLMNKIGYVEYGIQPLKVDKKWRDILNEARDQAIEERNFLESKSEEDLKYKEFVLDELKMTYSLIITELAKKNKKEEPNYA